MLDKFIMIAKHIEEEAIKDEIKKEIKKATKWHAKTFKDATLSGQLLKLEEEFKELRAEVRKKDSRKKVLKETADVLIVSAGLKRFDSPISDFIVGAIIENTDLDSLYKILEALREKMQINRARKWEKQKDGRFKHK